MMYWIIGTISLFALIFYLYFGHYAMGLFYQCMKHDVKISYWELAMMKRRGVPINDYLRVAIKLKEKDIDVKIKDLELHAKSGGRIGNVVDLLLKAKRKMAIAMKTGPMEPTSFCNAAWVRLMPLSDGSV